MEDGSRPRSAATLQARVFCSFLPGMAWEQTIPWKKVQKSGQPREGCVRPLRLALLKEVCPGVCVEASSASESLFLTSGPTAILWGKVRCYSHLPSQENGRSQGHPTGVLRAGRALRESCPPALPLVTTHPRSPWRRVRANCAAQALVLRHSLAFLGL